MTGSTPQPTPNLNPQLAYVQHPGRGWPGGPSAAAMTALVALGIGLVIGGIAATSSALTVIGVLLLFVDLVVIRGFVVVQPNSSRVLILFGRYVGTIREAGLWWVNPFTVFWRRTISLRVRNFQSERIKVNDASGNPIEIAAVVVWRVTDTAKAVFDVEDFEQFVVVQSETAVRHLASRYPYDDYDETAVSLRDGGSSVLDDLHAELQERLVAAGRGCT